MISDGHRIEDFKSTKKIKLKKKHSYQEERIIILYISQ